MSSWSFSDPFNNGGDWNPFDGGGGPKWGNGPDGNIGSALGFGTRGSGNNGGLSLNDMLGKKYNQERTDLYNQVLSNTAVDDITKNELTNMFSSTANNVDIASKLAEANAGKGIYAARLYNQAVKKYTADMPGRSQLSPSAQHSVI